MKILRFLLLGAFLLALANLRCLGYLWHVSSNQVGLLWERRPVSEVLADPATPKKTREKLRLIDRVRRFAGDELKLKATENYTSYVTIKRKYVSWNVSASHELRFHPYTWWFPITGSVPYKGYFEKELALAEYRELTKEGYDARVRPVPAYSTLGYFKDPILSSFMEYSDEFLIGLVIHEMVHATVYFSGDTRFNESLANFVEKKGLEKWYRHHGQDKKAEQFLARQADQKLFVKEIQKTARLLKQLYERGDLTDAEKRGQKKAIIDELKTRGTTGKIPFRVSDYENYFQQDLNNAYFQSILRYESGEEFFEKIYREAESDIPRFLVEIKKLNKRSAGERARLLTGESGREEESP